MSPKSAGDTDPQIWSHCSKGMEGFGAVPWSEKGQWLMVMIFRVIILPYSTLEEQNLQKSSNDAFIYFTHFGYGFRFHLLFLNCPMVCGCFNWVWITYIDSFCGRPAEHWCAAPVVICTIEPNIETRYMQVHTAAAYRLTASTSVKQRLLRLLLWSSIILSTNTTVLISSLVLNYWRIVRLLFMFYDGASYGSSVP